MCGIEIKMKKINFTRIIKLVQQVAIYCHELELKPEAVAEWVLTPMKPGEYELHCSIKGHKEAGMIGEIVVK